MQSNEMRKQIASKLTPICANTNYRDIPKPATYPYIVFDLNEVGDSYGQTRALLEINVVSKDRKDALNKADAIQKALDHVNVLTNKVFYHCYKQNRNFVDEEDKTLQRVRITFELFYYEKE